MGTVFFGQQMAVYMPSYCTICKWCSPICWWTKIGRWNATQQLHVQSDIFSLFILPLPVWRTWYRMPSFMVFWLKRVGYDFISFKSTRIEIPETCVFSSCIKCIRDMMIARRTACCCSSFSGSSMVWQSRPSDIIACYTYLSSMHTKTTMKLNSSYMLNLLLKNNLPYRWTSTFCPFGR